MVDREVFGALTDEQLVHYYGDRIGVDLAKARLDHFLLVTLYRYEKARHVLTLADLSRFSGATRAGVMKSANRLEALELVTSKKFFGNKRYVRLNVKRPVWVRFVLGKMRQHAQEATALVFPVS
jgi:hypothetical protein